MQGMSSFLVKYKFIINLNLIFYSSRKIGDYNSCSAELSEKHCTICDSTLHRDVKFEDPFSYCKCMPGFYEDDKNICKYCHFTWYKNLTFYLFIVQQKMGIDLVAMAIRKMSAYFAVLMISEF